MIALSPAYVVRRGLDGPLLMALICSVGFAAVGVLGLFSRMPLLIAALCIGFFGLGGMVVLAVLLANMGRVAFRVDGSGLLLGGQWTLRRRRPDRLYPWAQVESIWLWRTRGYASTDCVGIMPIYPLRGLDRVSGLRSLPSSLPVEVGVCSIPIMGWDLEPAALVESVRACAPNVAVFRALPGEPLEVLYAP